MAGISSKAAGSLENKKSKYNGYELNTDFDLNLYESFYRSYDPQLGRFLQIDPKAELDYSWSPYVPNYDNPISFNDPKGDNPPKDGTTNTVQSIKKNKDGSYTIKETLDSRKTTDTQKTTVTKNGKTYIYTKTTQQLSSTETNTTIDAKGNIVSSSSTTYNGVGTYYSDVYEVNGNGTLSSAGYVNAEQGDNWGFPQTTGSMVGPLAKTIQGSMSSSPLHIFPLRDDAEVYINMEFGSNATTPLTKAAEPFRKGSKIEEAVYKSSSIIRLTSKYGGQYNESTGDKLDANRFKYEGYYNSYLQNVQNASTTNMAGKPVKKN